MTVFLHRSFARRALLLATATCGLASPAMAKESATSSSSSSYEPTLVDTIVVSAKRAQSDQTMQTVELPAVIALPAHATGIAARAPGGALVGNGALSGQLSYRGLSGERVLGRVNGQRFATGGPNAMDPPLHYAPSVLLDRIELARGTSPVSDGPGLAGSVNAILLETGFGDGAALAPQAAFRAQYRSVDDSYAVGSMAGLANDRWRLGVLASREQGEDYDFAGGTATGTSFERNLYGVHAGFRSGPGELFAEYRRSETDPSGNPRRDAIATASWSRASTSWTSRADQPSVSSCNPAR